MRVKMPQTFQVLKCYKCLAFQVHQTKKSNKFSCKICNEKQSIKRHYGIGIAKDCRLHVQKLNKMRGEKDESICDDSDEYEVQTTSDPSDTTENMKKPSKWLSYIDNEIEDIPESNYKDNKRWPRNNKYKNYKARNIATKRKHSDVIDVNDPDVMEDILDNDNTKTISGKGTLFITGEDLKVNKISKSSHHDVTLPRNNNELKNNYKDFISISNTKLETTEVNVSSKWAQFIEREDIDVEIRDDESVENFPKSINALFSLCDESDIDEVLNI